MFCNDDIHTWHEQYKDGDLSLWTSRISLIKDNILSDSGQIQENFTWLKPLNQLSYTDRWYLPAHQNRFQIAFFFPIGLYSQLFEPREIPIGQQTKLGV